MPPAEYRSRNKNRNKRLGNDMMPISFLPRRPDALILEVSQEDATKNNKNY